MEIADLQLCESHGLLTLDKRNKSRQVLTCTNCGFEKGRSADACANEKPSRHALSNYLIFLSKFSFAGTVYKQNMHCENNMSFQVKVYVLTRHVTEKM